MVVEEEKLRRVLVETCMGEGLRQSEFNSDEKDMELYTRVFSKSTESLIRQKAGRRLRERALSLEQVITER